MNELNEISQLIAQYTAAHGVERVITQEIIEERLLHYFNVAKEEVEALGPEPNPDRSDFIPTATIFSSTGGEAPRIPCPWKDGYKRATMWRLSQICKVMLAQALIFRNVITAANTEKIGQAMGWDRLPDPHDRQKFDYFEEKMWRWIESNFGEARFAALPKEFRRDGIVLFGMGPKLKDCGCMAFYEWKQGNLIVGQPRVDIGIINTLIPRWWE